MANPGDLLSVIGELERANDELHRLNKRALTLVRLQTSILLARTGHDAEWTRLPGKGQRSTPGNYSRAYLYKLNQALQPDGKTPILRFKKLPDRSVHYSAADLRAYISDQP